MAAPRESESRKRVCCLVAPVERKRSHWCILVKRKRTKRSQGKSLAIICSKASSCAIPRATNNLVDHFQVFCLMSCLFPRAKNRDGTELTSCSVSAPGCRQPLDSGIEKCSSQRSGAPAAAGGFPIDWSTMIHACQHFLHTCTHSNLLPGAKGIFKSCFIAIVIHVVSCVNESVDCSLARTGTVPH